VHSEYVVDSRSRVRVRVGSPPHRPLGRIRFLSSRASPRVGLGRAGEEDVRDAVHASTPSLKKRSTIEAFDAAQNARPRLPPLTSLPPDAFVASFRTHPQCL
jgi:hypothetical protein